jgi:hypothetical protein
MPLFAIISAFIVSAVGAIGITGAVATAIGFVGALAAESLLLTGISRLLTKKSSAANGTAATDAGGRVQLAPSTSNIIPVVYGSAFVSPTITDAKISTDQKTMWYVTVLSEVTNTQNAGDTPDAFTFGNIYYDNKLVTLGEGDFGDINSVVSLTTNTTPTEVDTKIAGKLYMYLFPNGGSSGTNTGGMTAQQILSDDSIAATERWDGPIYTTGGQTPTMDNTAFIIVKIVYDTNAGTVRLGTITTQLQNTRDNPGDVFTDYLQNTRYGCAIPSSQIDFPSFDALTVYSNELITYAPVGGGTATQPRYRINGPINTGQNCMTNLQTLADACDSWIAYNEVIGKWQIIINQSYTDYATIDELYQVTDYNLIGGINVNPITLQSVYNLLEVQYPDANIKDQTDYSYISLQEKQPAIMSPNEPQNLLTVTLPVTNNFITATYIGERLLLASREGLTINFSLDYSGIQLTAGDVITVPFKPYGWDLENEGYGKLFRVMTVQEVKDGTGFLGAGITATEYNDSLYANDPIDQFIPDSDTGLFQTSLIGKPDPPVVTLVTANSINQMHVVGTVPTFSVHNTGQVLSMDFNYGNTSNSAQHRFYTNINSGDSLPLAAGSNVSINVTDIATGNVYWSVTAKNQLGGVRSNSTSSPVSWVGPTVSTANVLHLCNAYSTGNVINMDAMNANTTTSFTMAVNNGAKISVTVDSGNGVLAANTFIASVNSNTQIRISSTPSTALSNACINLTSGGITGNLVQPNTITYTNMVNGSEVITRYTYETSNERNNTVSIPVNVNTFGNISTGSWNHSKYLNAVYSGGDASSYNPYFQGTSSTYNGYVANSTGQLTPAFAAQLQVKNGDLDWYVLDYSGFASTPLAKNETLQAEYSVSLISTANTTIQIVPFISLTPPANINNCIAKMDVEVDTIYMVANQPIYFGRNYGATGDNITGGGVLIRQFTAATVYALSGSLTLSRAK